MESPVRRPIAGHDEARRLEVDQALRKLVGRDVGKPPGDRRRRQRPAQQQLAHQQQRPALSDELEGSRNRAELVVVGAHPLSQPLTTG